MMKIKVGCSGFPVAKDKYFKHFKLVEVQKTFYNPPQLKTAMKWRKEAPDGFEFIIKAWQLITHSPKSPTYRKANLNISSDEQSYGFFKCTGEVFKAWEETRKVADALKAKVILFQCPASFKPTLENIENMKRFFTAISRSGFIFAWEPRGSWDKATIRKLCQDLDLIHVVDPIEEESVCGRISYFRLHGGENYRKRYTDEELYFLKEKCKKDTSGYLLFNNLSMFDDARRFIKLLGF